MLVRHISTLLLFLPFFLVRGDDNEFQCGVREFADDMMIGQDFDSINPEIGDYCFGTGYAGLGPSTIHWHIYTFVPDIYTPEDIRPRISMIPEGLVEPHVKGRTLRFHMDQTVIEDYNRGDKIDASVNLYIPVYQLKNIDISGVGQHVEVINTVEEALSNIDISDSGVDNKLYITTPYSKINYRGSGVNTLLQAEAASGSSIDVSGVNQNVYIKTEKGLVVSMSGVNQNIYIDGEYEKISMSGVNDAAYINNDNSSYTGEQDYCSKLESSGVNNKCSPTPEAKVVVDSLSCVASTEINSICASWKTWTLIGGIIAAIIGVLILCSIGCCCSCCCCYGIKKAWSSSKQQQQQQNGTAGVTFKNNATNVEEVQMNHNKYDTFPETSSDTIPEAEVIEIKHV